MKTLWLLLLLPFLGSAQSLTELSPSGTYKPVKLTYFGLKTPQELYDAAKGWSVQHSQDSVQVIRDIPGKTMQLRIRQMDVIITATNLTEYHYDIAYTLIIKVAKDGLRVFTRDYMLWDNDRGWRELHPGSYHPERDKYFLRQLDAAINRIHSDLDVYMKEVSPDNRD